MKRWFIVLVALAAAAVLAAPAWAHGTKTYAMVSQVGKRVTVKLLDQTAAPVAGIVVKAAAQELKKAAAKRVVLAEGPKGVYTGTVSPPADHYDLMVYAELDGELFKAVAHVSRGADLDEARYSLEEAPREIEVEPFNWNVYLYIGGVIAVATAAAVAILRRPRSAK